MSKLDDMVRYDRSQGKIPIHEAQKRLRTTFIGAIASMEKHFGSLWGHGKNERDLTDEERWWRERWNRCRTEILDHGNLNIRFLEYP